MSLFRLEDRFRDLRKSPRFEVHYLGQIDAGVATAPVNCIICDISATGAKLTVGAHEVPEEFVLIFRRRCRVTRREDGQVGVKFVQS
jgi:PilZ domain